MESALLRGLDALLRAASLNSPPQTTSPAGIRVLKGSGASPTRQAVPDPEHRPEPRKEGCWGGAGKARQTPGQGRVRIQRAPAVLGSAARSRGWTRFGEQERLEDFAPRDNCLPLNSGHLRDS